MRSFPEALASFWDNNGCLRHILSFSKSFQIKLFQSMSSSNLSVPSKCQSAINNNWSRAKTSVELNFSSFIHRYNIDAVEKQTLQQALDNLQNNIQIKNRTHFVERLESITRRALLKFTDNANTNSLFISSDMFYLEISLDPQSGKVNDVKVRIEGSKKLQCVQFRSTSF